MGESRSSTDKVIPADPCKLRGQSVESQLRVRVQMTANSSKEQTLWLGYKGVGERRPESL